MIGPTIGSFISLRYDIVFRPDTSACVAFSAACDEVGRQEVRCNIHTPFSTAASRLARSEWAERLEVEYPA